MRQVESFYIPMSEAPAYANAMHLGSVAFSDEYSDEQGYTKEEGGLPYLYVMLGDDRLSGKERYGTVAVIDINHICKVSEAKRMMKKYGGCAWTEWYDRDGSFQDSMEIRLNGRNTGSYGSI